MRIAIGGISHETSTFAKTRTTLADFSSGFGLYRGDEIADRFRGSNICIGGFLEGAERHGFEAVPLLWGFAYPAGLVTADAYSALKQELLDRLQRAQTAGGPVDGVLLDQHGAMVVEGLTDPEADLLESVRTVVGADCPIMVTYDLHGNHSQARVNAATAIIGFDTYPHIDMAERGIEAADLIVRTIRGEVRPVTAYRAIPLFWSAACQITAQPPMTAAMEYVHSLEDRPGILSVTLATGFPWADIPNMSPSVIVVADNDAQLAEDTADEARSWIWERRDSWFRSPVSVSSALEEGERLGRYPIVLADHADNTGGGSPGDSTEILQTFLERGLRDAAVLYIVDPEVAQKAHQAGVGAQLSIEVGGKSDPIQGPPIPMRAAVRAISDGAFTYDGPMYAGLTGNMGCSAWLEQDGVHVVVVTAAEQPLGPAFARTLGLDPAAMKYLAIKSAVHFRASFEPISGSIFNVDARGLQTHDFSALQYHSRPKPMYPVDASSTH